MTRLDDGVLAVLVLDDPAQRLRVQSAPLTRSARLLAHATTVGVQGAPLLPRGVWGVGAVGPRRGPDAISMPHNISYVNVDV